jgi:hypothetical protein
VLFLQTGGDPGGPGPMLDGANHASHVGMDVAPEWKKQIDE